VLYLNAAAALANIDPAMEEAAENLGCTGWRKFRRITLPLMMPGLFAGGTLVFIWSFTELGTPLIMNYTRCAPVQVYDALKDIGSSPFPYALVFVMLAAAFCCMPSASWPSGGRRTPCRARRRRPTRRRSGAACAACSRPSLPFVLVILLALLPHLGVILTSFSAPGSWYRTVLPAQFTGANYTEALGTA
jgi:iron(III) transport system permease protein